MLCLFHTLSISSSRLALPLSSHHTLLLFFLMIPPPPRSTLFPYTTLFRSLSTSRTRSSICTKEPAGIRGSIVESRRPTYRSEEHTSELQSLTNLVCRLLLEKKKKRQEVIHVL